MRLTGPTGPFNLLLNFILDRKLLFRAIVLFAVSIIGSSVVFRTFRAQARTDLTVFLRAAEAVENKENIYHVSNNRGWNYVYFPMLAVLLVPFTKLPLSVAAVLWYLVSVAAFFGVFFFALRMYPRPRDGLTAACASGILCLPFFLDAFTRGQLGILILFFCIFVFHLYRTGQTFWAGFFLSLGFTLKFSPIAALYLFFLLKKEWKALAGGAAGGLVFLFLVPSLGLGFAQNFQYLREYRHLVWHGAGDFKQDGVLWAQLVTPFSHKNQSIYAVLTRLIYPSAEAIDNQANLWIRLKAAGCGAVLLAWISWWTYKIRECSDRHKLLQFSLFPMIMLFISPVAEMHHYSILFLVFYASFMLMEDLRTEPLKRLVLDCLIWFASCGFIFGYIFKEVRFLGFPLWGALSLCLYLFYFLQKRREAA